MEKFYMKFALYFGNRGFFPASLIAGAREEMVEAVTYAGYDYIIAPEELTRYGAVETRQEGWKYAEWLKSHEGEYDGVIMSLPNFSDENGAIAALEHCGKPPFGSRGNLQKALSGVPSVISPKEQSSVSPFKILLSHDSSHWRMDVLPHSDIQLTLSGHTHAMQFRIGRFSPSRWMYPEWYGLYETDARPADASGIAIRRVSSGPHDRATLAGGQQQRTGRGNAPRFLNVSAGLGGSFPFRLGAWPEIVVLTLHCPVSR